jgi:hypothetical protein
MDGMDGWMGLMDEWIGGWMDGCVDGLMGEWIDGWVDGIDEWMDGVGGWDGWVDE